MTSVEQFKKLILDPTLKEAGLYSKPASDLLVGTVLAESKLLFFKQIGGGPALGFFQMEPNTFYDIFHRYLEREDKFLLRGKVHCLLPRPNHQYSITKPINQLMANLPFAVLMARIRYLMVPDPIPTTPPEQAQYWKTHYNTEGGKGTVEKYLKGWYKYRPR